MNDLMNDEVLNPEGETQREKNLAILNADNIELARSFSDKDEAIQAAGEILLRQGYVTPEYIDSMHERERVVSVYIGNGVAIPHGINHSERWVKKTGLSVITCPEGVSFGEDKTAYVIIGIAAHGEEHMNLLMNISIVCCEEENVYAIAHAATKEEVLRILTLEAAG